HPEAARRLDRLDAELSELDPQLPDPGLDLADGFDLRTIDLGLGSEPRLEPGLDRGLDLGIDL
ncbi:MAG TPA: hypothetical protein VK988_05940, partial [Acidimicrobiales bacterium]|nr:hypothetical protein [Acidimicrobiales bacterium]